MDKKGFVLIEVAIALLVSILLCTIIVRYIVCINSLQEEYIRRLDGLNLAQDAIEGNSEVERHGYKVVYNEEDKEGFKILRVKVLWNGGEVTLKTGVI